MPKYVTDTDEYRGARFTRVDLSGVRMRDVNLSGAKIGDALLVNAKLSGDITGLRVNDVDVAPLVEALIQGAPLPAGWSEPEVARFRRLIERSEHKRWQAGVILKVSERAFGTGRLIPITKADPRLDRRNVR